MTDIKVKHKKIPHDPCPYLKKCGGCQMQHIPYHTQLRIKQLRVIKLLGRFCHVEKIIGMDNPKNYRNKLQYLFKRAGAKTVCGIYQSTKRTLCQVNECMLEDKLSQKIVYTICELCPRFKIRAYDIDSDTGLLRHVTVRKSAGKDGLMVILVTSEENIPNERSFINELLRRHPEITTIVQNVNNTNTPLFYGKKSRTLYGEGYIEDTIHSLTFRISPTSFYQVNPTQTEKLYSLVKEYAALDGTERVIDAYCGTGTISLILAEDAAEVIGVELNREATEDAIKNAEINSIKNARFICGDAGKFMRKAAEAGERIEVVVTDPPRSGASREFLESLLTLAPKKVVYVSCNPETLARDLYFLTKNGYAAEKLQPVDMFPHTEHVESVVCLTRK